MKTKFQVALSVFLASCAFVVAGCDNAVQRQAYEAVAKKESQLAADQAPALIAEYQQVIRLAPGSTWAKQAQLRIDSIKRRVSADELHKSVFQEHGID